LPKDRDYEEIMQEFQRKKEKGDVSAPDAKKISMMPDVFSFREEKTRSGTYGYIRIYTFNVENAKAFVDEFVRIAMLIPPDGLIIDVRGNGGGLITAGEKLLQVLTSEEIEPERFHFINTPLMLQLSQGNKWLKKWAPSIARSIETGAIYSQGFHLEDVKEYNSIGQKYYGPVVLITDALCYSTTDIFAAGFKDHKIGTILGVDGNTGAGGANVWTHDLLKELLPTNSSIQELPQNAAFRVAIRRTTRVGDMVGMPLEDLGVKPDCIHHMTMDDLLHHNKDLIEKAGRILTGRIKCENGEIV
jgi:C-terminal processing protease CtpA/Prc